MTNLFIHPNKITDLALGVLQREIVVANKIWTNGVGDFAGTEDDTINIRIPGTVAARTRDLRAEGEDRRIQTDTIAYRTIPVKLDHVIYQAMPLTDEELTLDLKRFTTEILQPQVRAVAEEWELELTDLIQEAPYEKTFKIDTSNGGENINFAFADARGYLNANNVPAAGRTLLVGANVLSALLKSERLKQLEVAGDTSALREATVGRFYGMDVVESQWLDPDDAFLFHKTAFIGVNRAPVAPRSAAVVGAASTGTGDGGVALRWIADYDASVGVERSKVDVYTGKGIVTDAVVKRDSRQRPVVTNGRVQTEDRFVRATKLSLTEGS